MLLITYSIPLTTYYLLLTTYYFIFTPYHFLLTTSPSKPLYLRNNLVVVLHHHAQVF